MKLRPFDQPGSGSPPRRASVPGGLGDGPRALWLGLCFIVVATLLAYGPVYSAGYIWDDDDYIVNNSHLQTAHGLAVMWRDPAATPQYYPLVFTSFWLEYQAWGLHPAGYHIDNVLLQIGAALLLWRVLAGLQVPGAGLAAAIFAVHPVEVESVAWVTERKNVLSAVFYLLAALAYLRFAGLDALATAGKKRWGFYGLAYLLFIAALLSKTVTCTLPATLAMLIWWKKGRLGGRAGLALIPFLITGVGLGLTTAWLERTHVGAIGQDWSLTGWERCLLAGRVWWFYATHLVFPFQLTFIYPRWTVDAGVWWQWLFPASVAGLVGGLWWARAKLGRGPLAGVLIYSITLAPAMGFFNVYMMRFSFVADHFQYLASLGLIPLLAARLAQYPAYVSRSLLVILALFAWQQATNYQDLETLWRDTLEKNPACWLAHTNLGQVLEQQGKLAEAEAHYQTALKLNDRDGDIHYDYGNLLAQTGRLPAAATELAQAARLQPGRPETHNNLGAVLLQLHQTDAAIAQFGQAVQSRPESPTYHYNLGSALEDARQTNAAVHEFYSALQLMPQAELIKRRLRALGADVN